MELRKLPAVDKRVETGPVQFGDDWPGLFIRGDNALGLLSQLEHVLSTTKDPIMEAVVRGWARLLESCLQPPKPKRDRSDDWDDVDTYGGSA